jgi:hypothetical protein
MKRLIVTDRGGIRNKRKSSGISVLVDSFRLGRKKANRNGKKKKKKKKKKKILKISQPS